jgi:hypothetical protein
MPITPQYIMVSGIIFIVHYRLLNIIVKVVTYLNPKSLYDKKFPNNLYNLSTEIQENHAPVCQLIFFSLSHILPKQMSHIRTNDMKCICWEFDIWRDIGTNARHMSFQSELVYRRRVKTYPLSYLKIFIKIGRTRNLITTKDLCKNPIMLI